MYIIKRISILFLFSLAGTVIMYFYGWASLQKEFIKWELLGKPPSRAIKVVALDYVQTESGDIYRRVYETGCNDDCWVISDNPPPDSEFWLPLDECGDLPTLDSFVDSKAICKFHGMGGNSLNIEAIDSKSFVYSWDYSFGGEWYGAIPWLSSFVGAAIGLFIGLIILLAILYSDLIKWLQKRAREKVVSEST